MYRTRLNSLRRVATKPNIIAIELKSTEAISLYELCVLHPKTRKHMLVCVYDALGEKALAKADRKKADSL